MSDTPMCAGGTLWWVDGCGHVTIPAQEITMYPDDAYLDDDAALMKRPSYFKFAREWLLEDPIWRKAERAGDEDAADARAAECADQILSDYRKHISE